MFVLLDTPARGLRHKSTGWTSDGSHGEIETAHPGCLGSQDTFYVGNLKGVGRIYQQTFVDTYSKVACCKLYTMKIFLVGKRIWQEKVVDLNR